MEGKRIGRGSFSLGPAKPAYLLLQGNPRAKLKPAAAAFLGAGCRRSPAGCGKSRQPPGKPVLTKGSPSHLLPERQLLLY